MILWGLSTMELYAYLGQDSEQLTQEIQLKPKDRTDAPGQQGKMTDHGLYSCLTILQMWH